MASVNAPISKDYELKIVNTEVMVPTLPMQQHILPLSNLDLLIPPVSVHAFFYSIGLPKVHCNNKGVRFTQAYVAAPLSQLNLYDPDESVQGKLVPLLSKPFQEDGIPVFAVQVTEFGCGGLVIGCTFDHRIADAYSANMFFTSWAKLSRNDSTASLNPRITRSILCPRDSPAHCAEINNMYVRHCSQEFSQENPHPPSLVSRIHYLDVKNIMDLQFNAKKGGKSNTKLEVFSAYLWKLLISTHKVKDTMNCKIGIVVDGRQHLREIGISANYFGNVLTLPFAESNAGYIKSKPLCWSAGLIHDAIKSAANEEHF
ncbi:hypothetical protein SUGI_0702650 [Cryptomeria japonica]|nr:hypothetical protein SUGI_0702650 [Cryptomeria japonica]